MPDDLTDAELEAMEARWQAMVEDCDLPRLLAAYRARRKECREVAREMRATLEMDGMASKPGMLHQAVDAWADRIDPPAATERRPTP